MKFGRKESKEKPIDWDKVKKDAKKWEEDGIKWARENGLTGRPPQRPTS